jgi:glutamine cyclotransferase
MKSRVVHAVLSVVMMLALSPIESAFSQPACIPALADIKGLAWDGQSLWAAVGPISGDDFIQKIDPVTGQVNASFAAPSRYPSGLSFDGEYLWQADFLGTTLYQIDPTTGATVREIRSPRRVTGLTWDGAALWVYSDSAALIQQLNPETGTTLNVFKAPTDDGEGLTWDGNHLWLTSTFETFKIDPEDGDVFETVDEGSSSAVTFDGSMLRLVERSPDEICQQEINTSPGASARLNPVGGNLVRTQAFDLVLLVKTPDVDVGVVKITFTFDLDEVTAFPPDPMTPPPEGSSEVVQKLASCLVQGTVQSRPGQTFRCPGLTGQMLGLGLHVLRASVELSDGLTLNDSVIWRVYDNAEP